MPFPQPTPAAAPAARPPTVRLESVVVVGNDAVLAARPATAVQLAHAALGAGFDAVIPASWGDEIVAAQCARDLAVRGSSPALFCACPQVAQRALSAGAELAPFMHSLVPPPVALARYLRALYEPQGVRLTYVGRCPGAQSDAYDARISPDEFLRLLADRGLAPASQPDAFDSVVPPDRRRHDSLPGGLPAVSALRGASCPHAVVELRDEDFASEIAQHLLDGEPVLIDGAVRLGCACAGAGADGDADPRAELAATEPPRAPGAVVVVPAWMQLDLAMPLPLASRAPCDLVAAIDRCVRAAAPAGDAPLDAPPHPGERVVDRIVDPAAADAMAPRRRSPPQGMPVVRPPAGASPLARSSDGRVLPRAYVARRRTSGPRPAFEDTPPPAAD